MIKITEDENGLYKLVDEECPLNFMYVSLQQMKELIVDAEEFIKEMK